MVETCAPAILWGTTAHKSFGTPYYSGLQKICHGVNVPLPGAGLHRLRETHERLVPILEGLRGPDGKLVIIGHSQGGLLGVLHAAAFEDTFVITLDSPHHGAPLCNLMQLVPRRVSGPILAFADMRPGSRFMYEYQAALAAVSPNLVSFATTQDKLVPVWSSFAHGARNIVIASTAEEVRRYTLAYGGSIEVLLDSKMGHISSMLKKTYLDLVHDSLDFQPLRLATA